jgi:hypothetical protein
MSLANKNTDGLVGMWSFDPSASSGQADDFSGNNNHGTIVGATPAIGKRGQALRFDGTTTGVTTNLSINEYPLAMCAWVKPQQSGHLENTILGSLGIIFHIMDTGENNSIYSIYDNNDGSVQTSAGTVKFNQWQHVCASIGTAGNPTSIYINGLLVAGPSNLTDIDYSGYTLNIGNVNGGQYFKGNIDEVRIYDRALSAEEIKDLYNLGTVKVRR